MTGTCWILYRVCHPVSIEGAVQALLELTGERASEAVVDQVFHRFCVGK